MEYNDRQSTYANPVFNEDEGETYITIDDNDCIENETIDKTPETRTYESLQRPSKKGNVSNNNLKNIPFKKFILVIVAVCFWSLVCIGLTYLLTIEFSKGNFMTNNMTKLHHIALNDSCFNSSGNNVNRTYGLNSEKTDLHLHIVPTECPDGWLKNSFTCYKVFEDMKTWFNAIDVCRGFGSNLVSFSDQRDENFIRQSLQKGSRYWTGLHDLDKDNKFEWSDGTVLRYLNWGEGEPNHFNNLEYCVELASWGGGVWNDANCYLSKKFICKIELSPQCGRGSWIFFNNSCYMFSSGNAPNFELSWNGARQYCKGKNADLTIINSNEELNFLLSQLYRILSHRTWIGLTNRRPYSEYIWIDDTKTQNLPWDNNQPRIGRTGCGLISKDGNVAGRDCDAKNGYICEARLFN